MAIDAKRSRLTFQKLGRELARVAKKPAPDNVHKFRTHSRRVEALLSEVVLQRHHSDEKLLKMLARLRKKAGRVRDLDVQIAALRGLRIPGGNGDKTHFLDVMIRERGDRERKLAKAFNRKTAEEIRQRLKRSADGMEIPKSAEPWAVTRNKLAQLGRDRAPLTEKDLHQYRILGKKARYVAELSDNDPEAKRIVEHLKRLQDVIGDWHDWLKLTQKAEKLLGSVGDSALVAMLRNVTQAKFRQSVDAVAQGRAALAWSPRALPVQSAVGARTSARSAAVA